MRINVDNARLPGVQAETTVCVGDELTRLDVFLHGDYVGQVVYVKRKRETDTEYGWRPAKVPAQSKLSTKVDAILRLEKMQ